jgi:threonine dehydrogenase-like Zn-dependent dehydrogenase
MRGEPLAVGDRITWSEYFIPGPNYCSEVLDLPQKSPGVDKYGHMAAATPPHHHGGFGEYCYILPQSWILRLPDGLSDAEAAPINCGVATMIAVTEAAEIRIGQTVVIQGLGLLGLYGAAIAKARGAGLVIGVDGVAERRARSASFGVDLALDPTGMAPAELAQQISARCRPLGADVVLEVCGDPGVIASGIAMLRIGGRYVLGGVVNPDAMVTLDANLLLRKMLTLRGVHNYHPRHLVEALDFVVAQRQRFPFPNWSTASTRSSGSAPQWPTLPPAAYSGRRLFRETGRSSRQHRRLRNRAQFSGDQAEARSKPSCRSMVNCTVAPSHSVSSAAPGMLRVMPQQR